MMRRGIHATCKRESCTTEQISILLHMYHSGSLSVCQALPGQLFFGGGELSSPSIHGYIPRCSVLIQRANETLLLSALDGSIKISSAISLWRID